VQKARLLLLSLISLWLATACSGGENAKLSITATVEAALATEVSNQKANLPSATATVAPTQTQTPSPTATVTTAPTASSTPSPTPTLWYEQQDTFLPDTVVHYGIVNDIPVVLYTGPEEAANKGEKLRTLPGDEVYIAYTNTVEVEGINFAEVEPGGWLSLESVEELTPSRFAGIKLDRFPASGFGWTIDRVVSNSKVPSKDEPGQIVDLHERYEFFEVHSVQLDEQRQRWFEINPGEWVPDDEFAYVAPVLSNPSKGATTRWISVNLSEQYLVVYQDEQPIFATLVSTGKETSGWATGEGIFTVYHKDEIYSLLSPDPNDVGNYLIQDVPYILYYQGSWALHGAYWHDNFGVSNSHGCVNLSPADAKWLFEWAKQGEWIILYRD
jgi:hypothetical protein